MLTEGGRYGSVHIIIICTKKLNEIFHHLDYTRVIANVSEQNHQRHHDIWNCSAYEFFEQEGNKVISVEKLAREMNLAPTAHTVLQDWIRRTDGKLGFHGLRSFFMV